MTLPSPGSKEAALTTGQQQALAAFQGPRTVLTVAHRLSSIVHADLIVVIEQGRVVEQGSHEALLSQPGTYASLFRLQMGGR